MTQEEILKLVESRNKLEEILEKVAIVVQESRKGTPNQVEGSFDRINWVYDDEFEASFYVDSYCNCCDSYSTNVIIPLRYTWEEDILTAIIKDNEERIKKEKKEEEEQEILKKEKIAKQQEIYDRKEYERLKKKYENQ